MTLKRQIACCSFPYWKPSVCSAARTCTFCRVHGFGTTVGDGRAHLFSEAKESLLFRFIVVFPPLRLCFFSDVFLFFGILSSLFCVVFSLFPGGRSFLLAHLAMKRVAVLAPKGLIVSHKILLMLWNHVFSVFKVTSINTVQLRRCKFWCLYFGEFSIDVKVTCFVYIQCVFFLVMYRVTRHFGVFCNILENILTPPARPSFSTALQAAFALTTFSG